MSFPSTYGVRAWLSRDFSCLFLIFYFAISVPFFIFFFAPVSGAVFVLLFPLLGCFRELL